MQMLASRRVYHHPKRDLAITHFAEDDESLKSFLNLGIEPLMLMSEKLDLHTPLSFHGHEIVGLPPASPEEDDLRRLVPLMMSGSVAGRTPHQTFASTPSPLPEGTCGGPVLARVKGSSNKGGAGSSGEEVCVGVLEGIVPADFKIEAIRDMAVFVEANEVGSFLEAIESGKAEHCAEGPDEKKDVLHFLGKGDSTEKLEKDMRALTQQGKTQPSHHDTNEDESPIMFDPSMFTSASPPSSAGGVPLHRDSRWVDVDAKSPKATAGEQQSEGPVIRFHVEDKNGGQGAAAGEDATPVSRKRKANPKDKPIFSK